MAPDRAAALASERALPAVCAPAAAIARVTARRGRVARVAHRSAAEATMGRALEAIRTRDLEELFGYFGVEAEPALVAAHRDRIAQRFAAEVREIVRLCRGLRERERFTLFREALRLAYGSATLGGAPAAAAGGAQILGA